MYTTKTASVNSPLGHHHKKASLSNCASLGALHVTCSERAALHDVTISKVCFVSPVLQSHPRQWCFAGAMQSL